MHFQNINNTANTIWRGQMSIPSHRAIFGVLAWIPTPHVHSLYSLSPVSGSPSPAVSSSEHPCIKITHSIKIHMQELPLSLQLTYGSDTNIKPTIHKPLWRWGKFLHIRDFVIISEWLYIDRINTASTRSAEQVSPPGPWGWGGHATSRCIRHTGSKPRGPSPWCPSLPQV